jgi:hypothetical protein
MPFIEHFELLNLLHFDVVETWSARESGSARNLLLHRYAKTSGLRERIQSMPVDQLATILKAGEDGDYFFVVTPDTPDFRRFLNWVEKLPIPQPPDVAVPKPGEAGQPIEPGEFTRMFRTPVKPPPAPPASAQEPGEFTQMFGRTNPSTPAREPSANSLAATKSATERGELTRLFKGATAAPQRPASATAPSLSVGGEPPSEFTKLFKTPLPETRLAERLERPQAEPEPAAPFSEPGDFTKVFGRSNHPPERETSATTLGAPRAIALDGVTGIFSRKDAFESTAPQAPMAAGPSDYTRIFQPGARPDDGSVSSPAPVQPEQKPAAPSQPEPKKQTQSIPIALVIILAAIAVMAVALILYFVMKR